MAPTLEHGKAAMTEQIQTGCTHDHAEDRFVFLDGEWQGRLWLVKLSAYLNGCSAHTVHFFLHRI